MHPDAVLISNYSSDYHRALHSFPTRRSSDLADFLFSFSFGAHFVYHQGFFDRVIDREHGIRSEEHTSELSHVATSYAVFCLKKKTCPTLPPTSSLTSRC